jgi:hypothetical protein
METPGNNPWFKRVIDLALLLLLAVGLWQGYGSWLLGHLHVA